ncbi:uncharacterized protein LY89DRAFT_771671 [Mollisia scopiformis]|uniref:Uncharacterized protein n=1 Tax=Mollisia scopiformis TaxID=149040 RepID=A0A194XKL3_MOLSC|nr:uncharacterized protein LY89DRAFT_771671 [Mollisia scopiformis]KUJ20698.1 hypothetical protein LY89DRAFT_771671 [Mollisia scopiformis]
MHYIRILKPPRLTTDRKSVLAKITITTDLGDSFLASDLSVLASVSSGPAIPFQWSGRSGMRGLEVCVPVSGKGKGKGKGKGGKERMYVRAKEGGVAVEEFKDVLKGEAGVVGVWSAEIDVSSPEPVERVVERRFGDVSIWEETGESIARHIWDAGLVLSALISQKAERLPDVLKKPNLKILELGAGCGIVGITMATSLPNIEKIILTDLPEAQEILARNIPSSQAKLSHQILDWAAPLPENVEREKWDLVVVADCTYNIDVVPDLVATLDRVREGSKGVEVLLAMKVRHESEMGFFGLMEKSGWAVRERWVVPLGMLGEGGEGQEIEIFVFRGEGG